MWGSNEFTIAITRNLAWFLFQCMTLRSSCEPHWIQYPIGHMLHAISVFSTSTWSNCIHRNAKMARLVVHRDHNLCQYYVEKTCGITNLSQREERMSSCLASHILHNWMMDLLWYHVRNLSLHSEILQCSLSEQKDIREPSNTKLWTEKTYKRTCTEDSIAGRWALQWDAS